MAETMTKRHPIRGLLWGIPLGLGIALVAVGQSWAALGTLTPVILFVVGLVLGTLWGMFGPAKAPKGTPPPEPVEVEQHDPGAGISEDADPATEQNDDAGEASEGEATSDADDGTGMADTTSEPPTDGDDEPPARA